MTEHRDRLLTLIHENSAFGIGRAYEKDLLKQRIRARLQELGARSGMSQAQRELINLFKLLDESSTET